LYLIVDVWNVVSIYHENKDLKGVSFQNRKIEVLHEPIAQ
jgi:hypothetical protein